MIRNVPVAARGHRRSARRARRRTFSLALALPLRAPGLLGARAQRRVRVGRRVRRVADRPAAADGARRPPARVGGIARPPVGTPAVPRVIQGEAVDEVQEDVARTRVQAHATRHRDSDEGGRRTRTDESARPMDFAPCAPYRVISRSADIDVYSVDY